MSGSSHSRSQMISYNGLELGHQVWSLSHVMPRHPRVSVCLAGLCFCFDGLETSRVNAERPCSKALTVGEDGQMDKNHLLCATPRRQEELLLPHLSASILSRFGKGDEHSIA